MPSPPRKEKKEKKEKKSKKEKKNKKYKDLDAPDDSSRRRYHFFLRLSALIFFSDLVLEINRVIGNDRAIETDVAGDLKPLKVVVEEDQTLTNISCIIVLPENHFELFELCNVFFREKIIQKWKKRSTLELGYDRKRL